MQVPRDTKTAEHLRPDVTFGEGEPASITPRLLPSNRVFVSLPQGMFKARRVEPGPRNHFPACRRSDSHTPAPAAAAAVLAQWRPMLGLRAPFLFSPSSLQPLQGLWPGHGGIARLSSPHPSPQLWKTRIPAPFSAPGVSFGVLCCSQGKCWRNRALGPGPNAGFKSRSPTPGNLSGGSGDQTNRRRKQQS